MGSTRKSLLVVRTHLPRRIFLVSAALLIAISVPLAMYESNGQNKVQAAIGNISSNPTTCTSVAGTGTESWTNSQNAISANSQSATVPLRNKLISHDLRCTGYSFPGLPSGATITGIRAAVLRSSGGGNESSIRILKNGVKVGIERSTNEVLPSTPSSKWYGGDGDLWGVTWTSSEVLNANFGVSFAATNPAGGKSTTTSVDSMILTVFYATPSYTQDSFRMYTSSTAVSPGAPLSSTNQAMSIFSAPDTALTPTFNRISVGNNHSCATTSVNTTYCWGSDAVGQLGENPTTAPSLAPIPVTSSGALQGKTITSIASGPRHACVLTSEGTVYCWGDNAEGQLGDGTIISKPEPVAVAAGGVLQGKTITNITAGGTHTCALASDGTAYCWGDSRQGQLGIGNTSQTSGPVAVITSGALQGKILSAITAGYQHTCALSSDGFAYCWGNNGDRRLGDGTTTNSTEPVAVITSGVLQGKVLTSIAAGGQHTCAVASDGAAYCWGSFSKGQLGNGATGFLGSDPVAVTQQSIMFTDITTGSAHTCAVASDGAAYCWGDNSEGQLGDSSITQRTTPTSVTTSGALQGKVIMKISAGLAHTCAAASDGTAYCWGDNGEGRLGTGSANTSASPMAVNLNYYDTAIKPNSFRMRTALLVKDSDVKQIGEVSLKLQLATKSAPTCSAQSTGFADVTNSTPIAWHSSRQPFDATAIAADTDTDPVTSNVTYQRIVKSQTAFTSRTTALVGQYMLWDMSLKNISTSPGSSYCLRVVNANGTVLDGGYTQFPEVITSLPTLGISFVSLPGGEALANPIFTFPTTNLSATCKSQYTVLVASGDKALRVTQNGPTAGWSVSVAPTAGQSALWSDVVKGQYYDFNDSAGSPAGCTNGSDGDAYAGQLKYNLGSMIVTPKSGCSNTGLSYTNGTVAFQSGVVDSVTLLQASSSAQANCYWDMFEQGVYQTIPANQPAGNYTLDLTVTAVSS